ncbi:MAG: 5'/3'-nucleotidase SurE [Variovorax sp.]
MRILVSNDDGHFSAGIAALERAARSLSDDVWVVAPHEKRSSMGHQISLHGAFEVTRLSERRYASSGTPADCVIAAMAWLFADGPKPDLVLSGVNEGRNIGEDIAYSGTLSIAREASFWGVPAIAFSGPKDIDYAAPALDRWLALVVGTLGRDTPSWHRPDSWLSINLPASIPASICQARPGRAKIASVMQAERKDGDTVVLRYVKGRSGVSSAGDETSVLDAGFASVYRLCWNGSTPLDDPLLARLNGMLARSESKQIAD